MTIISRILIPAAMLAAVACGNAADRSSNASDNSTAEVATAETDDNVYKMPKGSTEIKTADLPIVVDFNATWCGPCRMFAPVFHDAAKAYAGKMLFYSVDTDECPQIARAYNVQSIPQVIVLQPDGKVVRLQPGYMDKATFEAALNGI